MASAHEPLISYPSKNTTILSCKAFSLALTLASLICLATIIILQLPIVHHSNPLHPSDLCTQSPNPVACHAIVAGVQSQISDPHPVQILQTLINQSLGQLDTTVVAATTIRHRFNDLPHQSALTDCIYLLELSHDRLLDSATAAAGGAHTDARTWLSAVLTNYGTCLDELTGPSTLPIKANLNSLSALASASLSVLNAVSTYNGDVTETVTKFPSWVTTRDRKLLEASLTDVIPANVVVATDGSGDYDSVQDAVNSAPDKGTTRYVIHVRNGTYKENVVVGKKKTNVMIVGDGMNSTVITGSLNVVDGSTTFNSATLGTSN